MQSISMWVEWHQLRDAKLRAQPAAIPVAASRLQLSADPYGLHLSADIGKDMRKSTLPATEQTTRDRPEDQAMTCICQEQHRRGYCTEPGCPYSSSGSSGLLPCPFCGAEADAVGKQDDIEIFCTKCDARMDTFSTETAEQVTVRWNTRAPRSGDNAQGWLWFATAPRDGTKVTAWHKVWKCPVTVSYIAGRRSDCKWVEGTLTTEWPDEAFTHWQPLLAGPAVPSTDREAGK